MTTKYLLKHFAFGHNGDAGNTIYRYASDICDAFHNQATAYAEWAKQERNALDNTFSYIDFENTTEDFLSWLNQQFNMSFNKVIDFKIWLQNHDYITWFKQMSDDILLTLLHKLGGNRYLVNAYMRGSRYLDDGVVYQTPDRETFYQADKFNQVFNIANADNQPFYGEYTEANQQNEALQAIIQRYPNRFSINGNTLLFTGDYCDYYSQEEIDALHQAMHYPHY